MCGSVTYPDDLHGAPLGGQPDVVQRDEVRVRHHQLAVPRQDLEKTTKR